MPTFNRRRVHSRIVPKSRVLLPVEPQKPAIVDGKMDGADLVITRADGSTSRCLPVPGIVPPLYVEEAVIKQLREQQVK